RTSLAEFAAGREVRVVAEPPPAFPADVIATRALDHVGRAGYCPVVDNCEHFATWCATGRRASRQIDLIAHRMSGAATRVVAAVSTRSVGGLAIRTAVGTTVRAGLRAQVPTAIVGEVAALAAEWRAHRNGRSAQESRLAGERAGLATTAAAFALVGLRAGPAGAVAGAVAGAAVWAGGTVMRGRA
ncbi:MAG: lecithin retinol acyltransferase family protein, partial [Planctomycetaceae bacterium]